MVRLFNLQQAGDLAAAGTAFRPRAAGLADSIDAGGAFVNRCANPVDPDPAADADNRPGIDLRRAGTTGKDAQPLAAREAATQTT